jgi:hypothetical protein
VYVCVYIYVCVCIYIYIYKCMSICMFKHVCVHVSITKKSSGSLVASDGLGTLYVCMYVCMCLCINVCVYVCMYIYIYMYVCLCMCVRMYPSQHNHQKVGSLSDGLGTLYVCMYLFRGRVRFLKYACIHDSHTYIHTSQDV